MGFYSLWFSSQGNTALHWAILAKHSCSTSILVNKGKGSDILTMKNSQVTVLLYPCDISNVSDPDPGIVLLIQDPYQDSLWQRKKIFLQKPSYVFKPLLVRRTFRLQKILLTWKKNSLFGGQFLSAWIRSRIPNPGSDPLIHLNPDPVRIWIHPVGILIHPVGIRIHPVGIRIHPVRIEIQSGSWSETLATGILRHGRPSVYSLSRITCLGNKNF
jgi:hypothetical protein